MRLPCKLSDIRRKSRNCALEGMGMFAGKRVLAVVTVVTMGGAGWRASAQQGRQYTAADYAPDEKFMQYNVNSLVSHGGEPPPWLAGRRFWDADRRPEG